MDKEFLLDANAFFNLLKAMNPESGTPAPAANLTEELKEKKLMISSITEV